MNPGCGLPLENFSLLIITSLEVFICALFNPCDLVLPFMIFTIIGVIGLVITEIGILVLVAILPEFSLLGSTALLGTSWAKWLAKVIMTCIVLVWNYVGRKLFVFKS